MREDTDCTIKIENSSGSTVSSPIAVGTYTITITGQVSYTGVTKATYCIKAKYIKPGVTLSFKSTVCNGKIKKPSVTVKDGTTELTSSDYTVLYSSGCKIVGIYKLTVKPTRKSFTAKWKKITKVGSTSKKITNLKAKKKYYVRIRTYKTVNGKKYYSKWSKVKTVTTKK